MAIGTNGGVDLGWSDVTVFIYTLAVMVSGLWIGTPGPPEITPVIGVFGVFVALMWTVYFNWRIMPKVLNGIELDADDEGADEEDDATAPAQ